MIRNHVLRHRVFRPASLLATTVLAGALLLVVSVWTPVLPSAGSAAAVGVSCGRWMDPHQAAGTRADELLSAMTVPEKLDMLHQQVADFANYGAAGYIAGIPSLCVPPLLLNDAGSGLADGQVGVTAYPAEIAQAATWDPAAEQQLGASLGAQARAKGIDVLLAPDVNIVRTPLGGRTSESFGEDPFLAGQSAVAFVDGVQSAHVIATVKQFDANNQETNRGTINAQVAPRTLAEIYQPAFQAAVDQAHAGAVMCAYNQVNGSPSCQNGPLLRGALDGQMGFPGFVVSDWGATHSTLPSVAAGLDMEMDIFQEPNALGNVPFSPGGSEVAEDWYGAPLQAAVADGQVSPATLDGMVHRILVSMFAVGVFDNPPAPEPAAYAANVDTPVAQQSALAVAEAGSVLLKNANGALPITGTGQKIALIGLDAGAGAQNQDQQGGSVHVNQPGVITPLEAITARAAGSGDTVVYSDGSSVAAAAALARTADVAVVYAGYSASEGVDLPNLNYDNNVCELTCVNLPSNADSLISAVAAANPRTVVVLNTGGPALMPWLSQVRSVLEAWYPGEEDGAAAAALLFGDVDPSGKLPVTFPASLAQLPTSTAAQYPGVNGTATYSEGLLVGYRGYNARNLTPLFPFGFGLSYTSFRFSDLQITPTGSGALVHFTLTNTGHRSGADVSQVYVSDPASAGEPPQQLKGYQRTTLAPGGSASLTVSLGKAAFSYFDTAANQWEVAPGCFTVRVGDSSATEPLSGVIASGGTQCPVAHSSVQ